MKFSLQSFASLVNIGAAAAQASCQKLADLSVGSPARAIIEASGSVALWLQYMGLQIWLGCRLATSTGIDADSFVGDYGLLRQPAVPATGTVTFSRTFGISALVVPYFGLSGIVNTSGAQVVTTDGSQHFGVITDFTNPAWNIVMGGYFLPTGTNTLDVPVQALTAGTSGNVQPNTISLIASSIPGLSTVTNSTVFSNGVDAETDDALKARFQNFIATRARATKAAIANAIQSVQQNLSFAIIENTLPSGAAQPGFFTVTVDNGTGKPGQDLLNAVYASIDAARPLCSSFTVQAPAIIIASVNMTVSAASGFVKATLQAAVAASIEAYINGLGIGQAMSYTRLSALAFGVQGVANVTNVTLNNSTVDIGGGPTQVVKATGASIVVN